MKLKPNDLPEMEVGEVRTRTIAFYQAIGSATISDAAFTCDGLTFGTPTISAQNVTVRITADQSGVHDVLVTLTLAGGDTAKGYLRLTVADTCEGSRDYE